MRYLLFAVLFVSLVAFAHAATIHVPADQPTIQAGIDVALSGDTVLVAPGLYAPSTNGEAFPISIHNRNGITLEADGAVTIDCEGSVYDNLIYILDSDTIRVKGFKIQYAERKGVYCRSSQNVYIENNLFLDCDEGSLSSAWSTFYVLNNELVNTAIRDANGLSGYETSTIAVGNVVHGFHTNQFWNVCAMGFSADDEPSYAYVANNIIYDNDCGVWGNDTDIVIVNNTIHDHLPPNPSALKGRGIAFGPSPFSCQILNNIITGSSNDGIHIYNVSYVDIANNDVWDNAYLFGNPYDGCSPGPGDMEADPRYVDANRQDFHLQQSSPCINRGGITMAPSEDIEGDLRPFMGSVDMGADEYAGLHPLAADPFILSCAAGGSINFSLDAGTDNGSRLYLILGSLHGSSPGIPLPNNGETLPVNWDGFTEFLLASLNTPIFHNFFAPLNPAGQSTAQTNFLAGIHHSKIGKKITYAYCLEGLPDWDYVSNIVEIELVP